MPETDTDTAEPLALGTDVLKRIALQALLTPWQMQYMWTPPVQVGPDEARALIALLDAHGLGVELRREGGGDEPHRQ